MGVCTAHRRLARSLGSSYSSLACPPTRARTGGADTNLWRADGTTPLLLAVENADNATVTALLGEGADVNLLSGNGTGGLSPLFAALVYAPDLVEASAGARLQVWLPATHLGGYVQVPCLRASRYGPHTCLKQHASLR